MLVFGERRLRVCFTNLTLQLKFQYFSEKIICLRDEKIYGISDQYVILVINM